jgi:hypothetical protein
MKKKSLKKAKANGQVRDNKIDKSMRPITKIDSSCKVVRKDF